MTKRQARSNEKQSTPESRTRHWLPSALMVMVFMLPVALTLAQGENKKTFAEVVQVQAQAEAPAVAPATKEAKPDKAQEKKADAKPLVIDAELEKEIAKLSGELDKLKKGKTDYDLKEAELKKKQRELEAKKQLKQRQDRNEEMMERARGGATLDTDSETDMLLTRASEYAAERRYRDACVLWQHVLDQRPGLTRFEPGVIAAQGKDIRTAGQVLRPVRDVVELELAALPPEGLSEYRITADADARAVIAAGMQDHRETEAMAEVVRRFFISSLGDDAAYQLACIQMDEWDFVSARRLLEKVATAHPDPSMPRADLLLRLALANAKAGDAAGAKRTLDELEKVTRKQPLPGEWIAAVKTVIEKGAAVLATAGPVKGWPMSFGTVMRDGVMAGLPGKTVEGDALWLDQPLIEFDYKVPELVGKNQMMGTPQQGSQGRQEIVSRWEKSGWMPTTQVLLHEGKGFFKTHNELRWYDLESRKLIEVIKQPPIKLENGARVWAQNYYYGPQQGLMPTTTEEIAMFGDRIAKSMSIVGDTLYHLEGRFWMGGPNARIMVWVNNKQSTLQVSERLCAVDVRSNADTKDRVKWRYPSDEEAQTDQRFLAAPVPVGDRLLVPVMRNGELFLDGIETATGKSLFKTLLCVPPNDDSSRWATVGVSIVGSEAYIATGYGVVLAVDAGGGNILWAATYQRSEIANQPGQMRVFNNRVKVDIPGWNDDVIIPRDDKLIVLASDSDDVQCISRLTGKPMWHSPRAKATYVLGVLDDGLYVAGPNVIRRYGIHSGKLERDSVLDFESHARGALTPQGIYMPGRENIIRLDPETFKPLGKLRVATNSRDPVGNLFCDGEHLVAAGLDRVYVLSDGDLKMKELDAAIAKADSGALRFERAFLLEVVGKQAAAVEDLRVAHKLLPAGKDREDASRRLMLGLLALAKASPKNADALFDEALVVAEPLKQQVRVWLARGSHHADRGDFKQAMDLFLKAAQDTSEALVLVDEEDGRREARASLAAGAEIRALVRKAPQLTDELARLGEQSLRPHLELAEFDKVLSEPGAAMPQAAKIVQLETERASLEKEHKAALAAIAAIEKDRKQVEFELGVEKTTPTGKLEALPKQMADLDVKLAAANDAAKPLAASHTAKRKEIDDTRAQMATLLKGLSDLKANRVVHADRLLALGDLYPGTTVELQSHLLAARYLWNEDWFERTEIILQSLSASPNPQVAAAGFVALAQAYQAKKWDRQARRAWTMVKDEFANVSVQQGDAKVNAGDLAQAALASIKLPGDQDAIVDRRMPMPPYESAWSSKGGNHYFLDTDDGAPSQFLEDHLMMISTSNSKIICKNIETGTDLWHLSLQRSNYSGSSTTNGRIVQYNNYHFPNGGLVRQGHVALLSSPDRLLAFGMTSGRQLWEAEALEAPDRQNRYGYFYGYANPMGPSAMGSGVVVEYGVGKERGETQVRALDAQTGKVRWLAEFKNDQVAGLNAAQGYVFVFVNNGAEVIICDALTGQRTGRVKFENRQPQYPIVWTKHGMLSVNMQKAMLYELPSGKLKWTASLTGTGNQVVFSGYQRIDLIDKNRACVLNGGLFVLDLRDGKVTASASAADMGGRYINDAAATPDGKEIIAVGYGNQNEQTISVVDTETGKVKANINLGPRVGQQIQAGKVAAAGDLLPVLINDPPRDLGGGRKQYTNEASIGFFRKSDGKRVDIDLPGGAASLRVQNAQSPVVRGNVFMVLTYQSIAAYRHIPAAKPQELKLFVEPEPAKEDGKDDKDDKDGQDAKKGAAIRVIPAVPQLLPGLPVGGARIIIQGGKVEINGKPIEKKQDDKDDKKNAKPDADAKKDSNVKKE